MTTLAKRSNDGSAKRPFHVLAANLIDEETGRPVDWDNVRPSVILDVNGIKVGIIGVMTSRALQATIAANVVGLRVAPLVETITNEARALREQGASVVIVTAHAGSSCKQFEDPTNLSSCNMAGEIMRVASALPAGLVDHIIAGHVHRGIAHIVNGISITSAYSNTRAFSRVDFDIDANNRKRSLAKGISPALGLPICRALERRMRVSRRRRERTCEARCTKVIQLNQIPGFWRLQRARRRLPRTLSNRSWVFTSNPLSSSQRAPNRPSRT